MRSKTSFFNFTLFKKTIVRFWPIWFAYTFTWVVVLPVLLGGSLADAVRFGSLSSMINALQSLPLSAGIYGGTVIGAVFGCFAAMGAFSHLYSARSAGAFAALPLRREGVFTSVTLAGLLPMLAINILVFIAALLAEAAYASVYLPALLQWLALVSMLDLFFFSFAVLCAQLTGSLIVLPLVYAVLNFTVVIVELLVRNILSNFVFGFSDSGFTLDFLSPIVGIYANCQVNSINVYNAVHDSYDVVGYYMTGWGLCIAYAAVGLVLIAGSLLLYRRRRMETAGDVVAVSPLKPVFKYCLALGCALGIGSLLFEIIFSGNSYRSTPVYVLALILFMLIGCFIGYFAAEMLMQKSFAVWRGRRRWLGFCLASAVIVLLTFSCEFDLFGFESHVPSAETVESVSIQVGGDTTELSDPENIRAVLALHADIVAYKSYHENRSNYTSYLHLQYTLKSGRTVRRAYKLAYNPGVRTGDVRTLQDIVNTREAINYRKRLTYDITAENITYASVNYGIRDNSGNNYQGLSLTAEEANALYYDCILPDIESGALGRIWLINDMDYYNTVYNCTIQIECNERNDFTDDKYTYQYFYTVPTVDSVRTNAWLEAHGVDLHTEGELNNVESDYDITYPAAVYN